MQSDFGKLTSDWNSIQSIVLYGAGTVSRICNNLFQNVQIDISYVIDQDPQKQGKLWNGIKISSYEDIRNEIAGKKIVVMAAHAAYNDISVFLDGQGLVEFQDYCRIGQFICEWFWNARKMNCIYHVDMTVTTKCTFNCRHCNMFIPYYHEHKNYTFEELKENIDLFFERIDYAAYFGLIGGEPMLNPVLKDVIIYLEHKYRNKYGKISYASNGSVIPSDDLLDVMKAYGIHIVVSDYSEVIPYKDNLNRMIEKFKQYDIQYDIKPELLWCDFGFPETIFKRDERQMEEHLASCRPEWNGLNDGKFYYCNISWSAEKSGHFKLVDEDYIVLKNVDANDKDACHQIVELSRGTSSFCKVCGGCGKDNTNYVRTGVQLIKN